MHARETTLAVLAAFLMQAMLSFGLGIITPGYNLVHDYISTTSATDAPHAGAAFLLGMFGAALHLVFVRAMWDAYAGAIWGRISAAFFAGFFFFIAISALFQCDPGCAVETAEALTHTVLGFVAFTFLGLAALSMMVDAFKHRRPGHRMIVAVGILVVLADLSLLAGHLLRLLPGLVERATIVAMWLWTLALYRASRLSVPAAAGNPSTATH